jgi:hypothetical protein
VAARCAPGPAPRVVRLTRRQYENSVRALTGVPFDASDLPVDPGNAGFDRGHDLEVSDLHSRLYREKAEGVGRAVVASEAALKQVVGCETRDDACAQRFVTGFGQRTFRRPLTDDERTRYMALFKGAGAIVETGDAFAKGVRVVVEAMLQSPQFLYRIERSGPRGGGATPLSSWEIASRLSFSLANTTPDAELMTAAERNELQSPERVAAQARRLLESTPAGRATLRDFTGQWMGTPDWDEFLEKKNYPAMEKLGAALKEELALFFEELTFDKKRGLPHFFTSTFTYVNKGTAPFYDVKGTFTDKLERVDLDPRRRAGILTNVGFLAWRSYGARSSPIHRGVAVGEHFLCSPVPPPVPNVAPLPPSTAGKTMRQIVTEHTSHTGCKECHYNFINPLGFGLEHYDEAGKWRDTDMGQPVDATGTLVGTEKNAPFTDAVSMAKAIVEAPETRQCFSRQLWRYTFGRADVASDACAIDVLARSLQKDDYTIVDLMVDLTKTDAFLFRGPEVQ